MMWGYGWGWPMGLWMIFGSLFWLAALGVLIWALVHWLGGRGQTPTTTPPTGGGSSALEILRQRYARGEIDATTFEQMRERLEANTPTPDEASST